MELIYSVIRKVTGEKETTKDENILCRLSSKNIVAFSTTLSLENRKGSKETSSNRIYVCDINSPWDYFEVDSFPERVTALEWHASGFLLLVLTENGRCLLYEMKDFQLNFWVCKQKAELPGERFIAAAWFIQGHRVVLLGDRRDTVNYTEKISRERQVAPLQQFGGRPLSGFVAVTASNLAMVGVPRPDSEQLSTAVACLGPTRNTCAVADIDYDVTDGSILVVTSNGMISGAVATFRLKISSEGDMYSISVSAMASFHVRAQHEFSQRAMSDSAVSHVRLMRLETGLSVIAAVGSNSGSQLELWLLRQYEMPLHASFTKHPDTKKSVATWEYQSSVTHGSMPVSIATSLFPVQYSNLDPTSKMFQCIAVAYRDGGMKVVSKPSFQAVSTTHLDTGLHGDRRRRQIPCIVSMQQTFTGCGLVGIDQFGCMYMMKVVNTRDPVTQVPPAYLVAMLEYLTLSGHDCWDLLIALKPGIIEQVIQRFVDGFSAQSAVLQELLYTRHMTLRASLYRASPSGQHRAADCHARLLLHLVNAHCRALLQPKGLSLHDKGPIEKLSMICGKKVEADVDKVMMTLNPENKEFVIEERTLQAIQPKLQWVADLSLYLLTSLHLVQGYGTTLPGPLPQDSGVLGTLRELVVLTRYGTTLPGLSLLQDSGVLGTLRELLVLTRIWTVIHQRPLIYFTMAASNLDPLLEIFKLLTKVWQLCKENKGLDCLDEQLVDICWLLQSQLHAPAPSSLLLGNLHFTVSLLLQNHPLIYTYGPVPSHVNTSPSPDGYRGIVDVVALTHLGKTPAHRTRSCLRCYGVTNALLHYTSTGTQSGGTSTSASTSSTPGTSTGSDGGVVPALKAWNGKWLRGCMCGGHWKMD